MEEETTGQSKLFIILAVALIGLLVLGLMGIGGVFVIRQNLQEQAAITRPTPTVLIRLPIPTATLVPVKTEATSTPAPTPTNTPVLVPESEAAAIAAAAEQPEETAEDEEAEIGPILNRPRPPSSTGPGASESTTPTEVPNTGLGALEAILMTTGLVAVLFIARKMRMST